ncbi:Free fatty acid receptor [Dirofilaria immitis]
MDLVIDEITTERVKIIINEEGAVLSIISYILRTYAYLVIGTLLILINIPIFVLVITCKKLRDRYLVLVVVFLNNGFTGISAILSAMRRLINSANGERYIDHHECVLNIPTLLLTAYFLNGFSLLMNSIERFCVVAFPIYYYTQSIRISYSLIIAQYIITIIAITSTVVASLIEPSRQVSDFCLLQVTYSSEFYSTLLLLSTAASLLSVILMLIVVIILRKKFGVQYLSTHSHNLDLSYFLKNQKRYTHTALISCCFTFCMFLHLGSCKQSAEGQDQRIILSDILAVVPSTIQYIYVLDPSAKSRTVVIACVYLPFLNSLNMIIWFVCRQGDLRRALVYNFKRLFCGQKNQIQQTTVIGFGR